MQKRKFCLALCFVLFVSLIPGVSLMAKSGNKPTKVVIGGTDVYNAETAVDAAYWTTNDEGKLAVCTESDSWNVHYDKDEHTLYLKNANITGDVAQKQDGIAADGNLTLIIEGANEVSGWTGIYVTGNLDIKETASGSSLMATGVASDLDPEWSAGIRVTGDLTVHSGEITSKVTDTDIVAHESHGVFVEGHLSILGGTLTAFGGTAEVYSNGIKTSYGIIVSGGKLVGYGGNSNQYSVGILSDSDMTVTGGEVIGTGGTADFVSTGVFAEHTIFVTDSGKITGYGGTATRMPGESDGIKAWDYNISGGEVYGYGGEATDTAGIVTFGQVYMTSGNANGVGGPAIGDFGISQGVYAEGYINVNGGSLTGCGGTATGKFGESYGVYSVSFVQVFAGKVTGSTEEATISTGVYVCNGSAIPSGDGEIIGTIIDSTTAFERKIRTGKLVTRGVSIISLGVSAVCLFMLIRKKKAENQ